MKNEIINIIAEINPYVSIDDNTNLIEEEILDSLGIMVLINELEQRYNITIPIDSIQTDDFVNLEAIINMINRY